MMRVLVFCSSIFHLEILLCVHSMPLHERTSITRYKGANGWPQNNHDDDLKNIGGLEPDTLNEDHHLMSSIVSTQDERKLWKRPRCGVPNYPRSKVDMSTYNVQKDRAYTKQHRRKRFVLFGGRWDKTDLTYKIMRFPWQMSQDKVRGVFRDALRVWSEVSPLTFTEVSSGRADIIIDFNRYWHGDNLPFDGAGGILAHAFFPRTHREGDIHFDYDENWTLGNEVGTDLLQVAAHEFGHVLGLQHSLVPGAVMSPFYSFSYPLELSQDDKDGIQHLYGPPQPTTPDITETNEIDTGVPDACRTNFDAVSMIRGELFFFKSRFVWRIRDGRLQAGYPALASRHWRGIPEYIDAAYEDESGNIWFIKGDSYWVFDAERRISGPESVQRLGLPVTDIQAAVPWGDQGQNIYLLKSGSYWRFSAQENRVDAHHPFSMRDWRGMPSNIDAAFRDGNGYVHFLSGMNYWTFDPVEMRVLEGYPRNIGVDFFGCTASPHG